MITEENNNVIDMNQGKILDLKHGISSNSLHDVCEWLKEGAYVIIHNNYINGRYFHHRCPQTNEKMEKNQFLLQQDVKFPVVYLDVKSMPGLLDDGEWEWYIKNEANSNECTCFLKDYLSHLSKSKDIGRSIHLCLGSDCTH